MWLPVIQGVIDRRLLINYRVDPSVLRSLLPAPFCPQLVGGYGLAGVCLIRFRGLRPGWWPAGLGFSSENAAHRIAVEWNDGGTTRTGVYVVRRQTNSLWNAWAGGRLFPGCHDRVQFAIDETPERMQVGVIDAGAIDFEVQARITHDWPHDSVFPDAAAASQFFRMGASGYSAARGGRQFEGLELCCREWRVEPLAIERVQSRYFQNLAQFPCGSAVLDCGLLMRGIEHEWRALPDLCCPAA
jgi:hypothetical protein